MLDLPAATMFEVITENELTFTATLRRPTHKQWIYLSSRVRNNCCDEKAPRLRIHELPVIATIGQAEKHCFEIYI